MISDGLGLESHQFKELAAVSSRTWYLRLGVLVLCLDFAYSVLCDYLVLRTWIHILGSMYLVLRTRFKCFVPSLLPARPPDLGRAVWEEVGQRQMSKAE